MVDGCKILSSGVCTFWNAVPPKAPIVDGMKI